MKMVRPDFAARREPAAVVQSGANSALHRFDDFLVFHLDDMEICADPLLPKRFVPHV